jgi:hypothetical protein
MPMTKEQLGKEIKDLVRSIKTHYTFVEDEDRIPLIELELITSKIRKLYEKSVIFNFLNSPDEDFLSMERSRKLSIKSNFEKINKEIALEPKIEAVHVNKSTGDKLNVEKEIAEIVANEPTSKPILTQQVSVLDIKSSSVNKVYKDLKLLVGINDKFLLINNLFGRSDQEYKESIEKLSALQSFDESIEFLAQLASQKAWNTESYAYVRLLQIIEKRYK